MKNSLEKLSRIPLFRTAFFGILMSAGCTSVTNNYYGSDGSTETDSSVVLGDAGIDSAEEIDNSIVSSDTGTLEIDSTYSVPVDCISFSLAPTFSNPFTQGSCIPLLIHTYPRYGAIRYIVQNAAYEGSVGTYMPPPGPTRYLGSPISTCQPAEFPGERVLTAQIVDDQGRILPCPDEIPIRVN